MEDDILVSKAGTIERCCSRAREEYEKDPATFSEDLTRQDAATLNVIRAWEAAIEMGDYVIGSARLGLPHDEREVITLLADNGWIAPTLAEDLKRTGEFCRAEWDYQQAPLPALVTIIKRGLDDFRDYATALMSGARTTG
ncbi:type VII toxin-antitoxin system HepT family RNase toxin [Massilia niastensis]|uniref:type VII toxin-antitoxin system HepT family RNase toxin n=1 Tax=Massilia niastensis TaxID=544911 RepID=UPI00037D2C97|nr:HepT-like ribonuclease domain-containing protein [Massilia niastensis]